METAILTVVRDGVRGIYEQEIFEAKTLKALKAKLKKHLPDVIKDFHIENDFLEEEDDKYIQEITEDLINEDEDEVYDPSPYEGSGFIQVKHFYSRKDRILFSQHKRL